eukprot:1658975-Amphidinium_carterae.1
MIWKQRYSHYERRQRLAQSLHERMSLQAVHGGFPCSKDGRLEHVHGFERERESKHFPELWTCMLVSVLWSG